MVPCMVRFFQVGGSSAKCVRSKTVSLMLLGSISGGESTIDLIQKFESGIIEILINDCIYFLTRSFPTLLILGFHGSESRYLHPCTYW